MANDSTEEYTIPELMLTITTYEKQPDSNKYMATVTHAFHASDQKTLFAILDAHRMTDVFFDASFRGVFQWKDGIIILKNSEPSVSYP